jgi:hypothetical protein
MKEPDVGAFPPPEAMFGSFGDAAESLQYV